MPLHAGTPYSAVVTDAGIWRQPRAAPKAMQALYYATEDSSVYTVRILKTGSFRFILAENR